MTAQKSMPEECSISILSARFQPSMNSWPTPNCSAPAQCLSRLPTIARTFACFLFRPSAGWYKWGGAHGADGAHGATTVPTGKLIKSTIRRRHLSYAAKDELEQIPNRPARFAGAGGVLARKAAQRNRERERKRQSPPNSHV